MHVGVRGCVGKIIKKHFPMNDKQRNKPLPCHRQARNFTAAVLTIIASLFVASCGEKDEPAPEVYSHELKYEISQEQFPGAGGEASLKLSVTTYDKNWNPIDANPEATYEVSSEFDWIEIEPVSDTEYLVKVAPNKTFRSRTGQIKINSWRYGSPYFDAFWIDQDKSEQKLQYESLSFSSSGRPYEWFTDTGWHLDFDSGWAFVNVKTYDGKEPTGVYSADWISRVAVSERTWVDCSDGAKAWYVGFYCDANTTPDTRTAEVWVEHGDEKLGPFVIEQEKFHTMAYPGVWLYDWSNLSSNGTQCYVFLDCYNDEQPWLDIDSSWARVTSTEVAFTEWSKYFGMNYTRWRLIITVDKNYGSHRSCTYYCRNASGENYGPFTLGQQGAGGGSGGGGGSSSSDESKSFSAYAWLETSGGYTSTMTLEHVVDHLNQYGITIYKSGSSYYFVNFDDKKVYCSPSTTASTYTYYSDYEAGDKYNNYKTKKAIIYVRFAFSAF